MVSDTAPSPGTPGPSWRPAMKGLMSGTILKITPGASGLGWKMLLYCIFLRIEKHNHFIDEWGRQAGQLLKSVEKANRPNRCTLASDILRRDPCRRELALPGTLFQLSHQGGGPTQPCHCVLWSLEVQTPRQYLPGSRRITRTISVHRACPPHWAHTRLFTLQAPGFPVAPSGYEGCSHLSAGTSSSCPKQWPLSVLHFNLIPPSSHSHLPSAPRTSQKRTKNKEEGILRQNFWSARVQGMMPEVRCEWCSRRDGAPKSLTFGGPACCILLLTWEAAPSLSQGAVGMSLYVLIAQSCLTPCNSVDCSSPGSSVHGILQARILEWVAIPFSKGYSWLRSLDIWYLHFG